MTNNNLVPFSFEQASGQFQQPSLNSVYINDATKNAIKNAWDQSAVIDSSGKIWVQADFLHTIIRTSSANAKYLIGGISDYDKNLEGGILYIRGTAVYQILDNNIQNAGSLHRESLIRFSEMFYTAIRDCSRAQVLRVEFYEYVNRILGNLKRLRINQFNIKFDELTGYPIDALTCEFSHIRSVSLFPQLAGLVENGLIVNKPTHNKITAYCINDERELLALCISENWSTSWHQAYQSLKLK